LTGEFLPSGAGPWKDSKYKMTPLLQKYFPLVSIALLVALVVSLFLYPHLTSWISITLLVSGFGVALVFTIQKHLDPYKQGQITGLKFMRNILLDILGLLLTMAAASYLGGMTGASLGESYGLWVGLIAAMGFAFVGAWLVRKLWSRLIKTT